MSSAPAWRGQSGFMRVDIISTNTGMTAGMSCTAKPMRRWLGYYFSSMKCPSSIKFPSPHCFEKPFCSWHRSWFVMDNRFNIETHWRKDTMENIGRYRVFQAFGVWEGAERAPSPPLVSSVFTQLLYEEWMCPVRLSPPSMPFPKSLVSQALFSQRLSLF